MSSKWNKLSNWGALPTWALDLHREEKQAEAISDLYKDTGKGKWEGMEQMTSVFASRMNSEYNSLKWEFQDNHWLDGGAWETGLNGMLQTAFTRTEKFPYLKPPTRILYQLHVSPPRAATPELLSEGFPIRACIIPCPFSYPLHYPGTLIVFLPSTTDILGTDICTHRFCFLTSYSTDNPPIFKTQISQNPLLLGQ